MATNSASAHPHIFIKYDVEIAQKSEDTYTLHFTFTAHNVVTPHPLFKDQVPPMDNLLDALGQHPAYMFLDVDGHSLGQQSLEFARSGGTDDEPIFSFDAEVPAGQQSFGFSIYNPEYYDAVSLDGAEAVKVDDKKLNCAASYEEVGTTMWGVNSTSHVECGLGHAPVWHSTSQKKFPFETPSPDIRPFNNQMLP